MKCQQASTSISAVDLAIGLPAFVKPKNSSGSRAHNATNGNTTEEFLAEQIAAAAIGGTVVGGAAGGVVAHYYNALQEAAAARQGGIQDDNGGIELQEDTNYTNSEWETVEIPSELPTEASSAMQTSYPRFSPSSTGFPQTSNSSASSLVTAAPSVVAYSQDWMMPAVSVNIAAISEMAAQLQIEFNNGGILSFHGPQNPILNTSGPSNITYPMNGTAQFNGSSLTVQSLNVSTSFFSTDLSTLPILSSTSTEAVAIASASPVTKVLPDIALSAWVGYQSFAAKFGYVVPTGIDPATCYTTQDDYLQSNSATVYCCFDAVGTVSYRCISDRPYESGADDAG